MATRKEVKEKQDAQKPPTHILLPKVLVDKIANVLIVVHKEIPELINQINATAKGYNIDEKPSLAETNAKIKAEKKAPIKVASKEEQ